MLHRIVSLLAAVLLVGACGTMPQTSTIPPAGPAGTTLALDGRCTPGQTVIASDKYRRIDILGIFENLAAFVLADGQVLGDVAKQMYADVKAGKIPRFEGESPLTIRIDGAPASRYPAELMFLAGHDVCQGMTKVNTVSSNRVSVDIIMRGGEHLGQASLMIPVSAVSGYQSILVCIKAARPVYVPKLDAGRYQAEENLLCGLPGTKSGWTRFSENVANPSKRWILYPLIYKR